MLKPGLLVLGVTGLMSFPALAQDKRPNFVWFMTEDVSDCYLSLYNNGKFGAKTPNVEKLAENGVVFRNAYSNAAVSSAARSTLITGCYAPSYGISWHRRLEETGLPKEQHFFPFYLRLAGYHTSNSDKLDYNCRTDQDAWDIIKGDLGDWRKRPDKNMPFFHVRTKFITHESKLQFSHKTYTGHKTKTDPNEVFIHPNHPDTDLFRYTYATFYDRINDSDKEVGQLIDMLKEDGELDNTFIFYFGDNGGSLPGSKGYITETGLTVPLVVYVPEKWRKKLSVEAGSVNNGFVNFMDLGPTLLHLAGIEIPDFMDGQPVLGEDIAEKDLKKRLAWGYGDRYDECYAFSRSVTKGRYMYVRNFNPYHPKSLYAKYRFNQLAFREWKELYEAGKLNAVQSAFFLPQGAEELYDLESDPYQTKNLVKDKTYGKVLKSLRNLLKSYMEEKNDLGLLPECEWLEGKDNTLQYGKEHTRNIKTYSDILALQLVSWEEASKKVLSALRSTDPVERYWGATVCASFGKAAVSLDKELKALLADPVAYVRVRAAVAITHYKDIHPEQLVKQALKDTKSGAETLLILNDVTYIHDHVRPYDFGITRKDLTHDAPLVEWRINHLNGTEK